MRFWFNGKIIENLKLYYQDNYVYKGEDSEVDYVLVPLKIGIVCLISQNS